MKKLIFSILALAFFSVSCEKIEDACESEKNSSALVFDFPDSIQVDTSETIEINYVLDNGCGSFEELEVENSDFYSYEIKVKTKYQGCNCTANFVEGKVDFVINMSHPGIYEFKFWVADGDYDTYSLKVYN